MNAQPSTRARMTAMEEAGCPLRLFLAAEIVHRQWLAVRARELTLDTNNL